MKPSPPPGPPPKPGFVAPQPPKDTPASPSASAAGSIQIPRPPSKKNLADDNGKAPIPAIPPKKEFAEKPQVPKKDLNADGNDIPKAPVPRIPSKKDLSEKNVPKAPIPKSSSKEDLYAEEIKTPKAPIPRPPSKKDLNADENAKSPIPRQETAEISSQTSKSSAGSSMKSAGILLPNIPVPILNVSSSSKEETPKAPIPRPPSKKDVSTDENAKSPIPRQETTEDESFNTKSLTASSTKSGGILLPNIPIPNLLVSSNSMGSSHGSANPPLSPVPAFNVSGKSLGSSHGSNHAPHPPLAPVPVFNSPEKSSESSHEAVGAPQPPISPAPDMKATGHSKTKSLPGFTYAANEVPVSPSGTGTTLLDKNQEPANPKRDGIDWNGSLQRSFILTMLVVVVFYVFVLIPGTIWNVVQISAVRNGVQFNEFYQFSLSQMIAQDSKTLVQLDQFMQSRNIPSNCVSAASTTQALTIVSLVLHSIFWFTFLAKKDKIMPVVEPHEKVIGRMCAEKVLRNPYVMTSIAWFILLAILQIIAMTNFGRSDCLVNLYRISSLRTLGPVIEISANVGSVLSGFIVGTDFFAVFILLFGNRLMMKMENRNKTSGQTNQAMQV